MTRGLVALFAFCCGAIVANLYYAQPIVALIAADIGLAPHAAGLIVSLTQIGYALGLFFLVPLGDRLENRRLMIATTAVCVAALAAISVAARPPVFLACALLVGIGSVSVQMMIPLAANLAPEASRGRIVGSIMGGLLAGIMLARPLSSAVADAFGWRAVFGSAAVVALAIVGVMAWTMPTHEPAHRASYGALLRSLGSLLRSQPVLRERAFAQGCMFASFTLFWTAAPLELMRSHGFTQLQIAGFALVGAIGAIAAPIGGRLADAGHVRGATLGALGAGLACYAAGFVPGWGFAGLLVIAVVLDFCVQINMVVGQREIYALDPASRSRINALYMTSIFVGGSIGAVLASVVYENGGWHAAATVAALFPAVALVRFLVAARRR
nr:MFS transporter [Schlegelella koreensis]